MSVGIGQLGAPAHAALRPERRDRASARQRAPARACGRRGAARPRRAATRAPSCRHHAAARRRRRRRTSARSILDARRSRASPRRTRATVRDRAPSVSALRASCLVDVRRPLGAGVVDVDRLPLAVELDRGAPHLARADAGRLHAAERQLRLATDGRRVDVRDAGLDVLEVLEDARRRRASRSTRSARTSTSLATFIASSKSLTSMIDSTGPKISSCAMRMSGFTPTNTVGATKKPLSPTRSPPTRQLRLLLADLEVAHDGLELPLVDARARC